MSYDLDQLFSDLNDTLKGLQLICLTTEDGFAIRSLQKKRTFEDNKVAAITSSLSALSNAAAQHLTGTVLNSTCIETNQGNLYLFNTLYQNKKSVLCVVTGQEQNMEYAKYHISKLAAQIMKQPT